MRIHTGKNGTKHHGQKMRIPVVGLCRFSYPSKDGSGFKNKAPELLYDYNRLKRRLSTFENILLPSVSGQSDKDFTLGVLIGSDLPEWCRDRLVRACRKIPQIKIIPMNPGIPHGDACSEAILSLRPTSIDYVAEFRLDDDDGVSSYFIESVKRDLSIIPPGSFGPVLELNYPKGYHIYIGADVSIRETIIGHLTCAQAWLISSQSQKTMFSQHHYNFWRRGPCISMPQKFMYIRGMHDFNDTKSEVTPEGLKKWQAFQVDMSEKFNIKRRNIKNLISPS